MKEQPVNISSANTESDLRDNVADILDFIGETLCWISPEQESDLSSRAVSGLWHILNACSSTLRRME
jgi:hypothetical protein